MQIAPTFQTSQTSQISQTSQTFQNSNNYAAIPVSSGRFVGGSFIGLSESINNATKPPLMLVNDNSVEENLNLTASLNAFVDVSATENKKNILSTLDINKIKVIAEKNEWKHGCCHVNVQRFLNLLPDDIREKLTAIISTHESHALPYYGTDDYGFHAFILGKTENDTLIIDLSNKNFPSSKMLMTGGEFFSKAFNPIIKRIFQIIGPNGEGCTSVLLKNNLPEFRLIPSQDYVKSSLKNDIYCLTRPNSIEKSNPFFLSNRRWRNSHRLNIFEFFSLVNNEELWGNLVKKYDNLPVDRLGIVKEQSIQSKLIKKLEDISR